jgi:hypothetical protein
MHSRGVHRVIPPGRKVRRCWSCVAAALALAPPAPATGQNLLSGVHVGVAYSDNITHTASSTAISTTWLEAGLAGQFAEKRTRFEADLDSDVSYRKFSRGDRQHEFFGGVNGHARVRIFDDSLIWIADDVYGQSSVNSFGTNSPVNRQGTNYFSTGPDLYAPLGNRTRLFVRARYALVSYQTLLLNNKRRTGEIGAERRISAFTTVRLGGSASRVEFDEGERNPPYDLREAHIGAHREGTRTTLDSDVGYTNVRSRGTSRGGLLFRASATRDFTKSSSITVTAGQEYSDSAEFFRLGQLTEGPGVEVGNAIAASDPLHARYVYANWVGTGPLLTLRIDTSWRQERRLFDTELDVNRVALAGGLEYLLSPRMGIGLYGRIRNDRFTTANQTVRETALGVRYTWRLGTRLNLGAAYERSHGTGDSAGIHYNENLVSAMLYYTGRNAASTRIFAPARRNTRDTP